MANDKPEFSVCIGVYFKDNPTLFIDAVRSVTSKQSLKPSELIIVADGPLSQPLEDALSTIRQETPDLKLIRFEQNRGHAASRQAGLDAASNDLVAIMDADDIASENRFELQIKAFEKHPEASVIGGQIKEFIDEISNVIGERIVPVYDSDIKRYLKSRSPMNFVTVMYRKSAVQDVGGFIDWYCEEDYYLWVRLAEKGYKFYNLNDNLVNVRVGEEMYRRRGGWKYFKSEARLQRYMFKRRIIGLPRYLYNVAGRFVIQVAMPNSLRGFIFQKLFRK